jgi:S1-C subfamily serine protease
MRNLKAGRIAALAALALLPAASPRPAPAADAVSREIAESVCAIRKCPPCIVRIHIRKDERRSGSGTGILLADGRVLTAAHLLRHLADAEKPQVWFGGRDGRPRVNGANGRRIAWTLHPESDLAVISGVGAPPWARGAELAPATPRPGERVTVVGIEHTGAVRAYAGTLRGVQADPPMLALDLTTQKGDSGGPVFDTRGRLVGILSGAGKIARTTTSTLEAAAGSAVLTHTQEVPAAFAVDLGGVDWKAFAARK